MRYFAVACLAASIQAAYQIDNSDLQAAFDEFAGEISWANLRAMMASSEEAQIAADQITAQLSIAAAAQVGEMPEVCEGGAACRADIMEYYKLQVSSEWHRTLLSVGHQLENCIVKTTHIWDVAFDDSWACEPECPCDYILTEYREVLNLQREITIENTDLQISLDLLKDEQYNILEFCPEYEVLTVQDANYWSGGSTTTTTTTVVTYEEPVVELLQLVDVGVDVCSADNPCTECQGDCDSDSQCLGDLRCFQRDVSSSVPPGCLAGGVGDIYNYDYCYNYEPFKEPSTGPELVNLGGDACTEEYLCSQCRGDCDNDNQCMEGLRCFQRDGSDQVPPGCVAGGVGDVPTTDYCYLPSNGPELVNLGADACTADRPCDECQGDCDNDSQCLGDLRCFQRDGSDQVPPGCIAGGAGDIPTTDYCYNYEPYSEPSNGPELVNLGSDACTEEYPCSECQGDCDNDNQCLEGLECFKRDSSSEVPPGCVAGGVGDIPTTDYCYLPQ